MAGEFAAVGIMVAEHAEIAAALREDGAAFIGQDLQTVFGQLQIPHDFRAEEARHIGAVGIGEAGIKFA